MIQSRLSQYPLISAVDTAEHMVEIVRKFSSDIGDKAKWPLKKFYEYVRALPFRADPKGHESIARPRLTMESSWPWRDCDDKSILLGSWLYQNNIPFLFRASSKMPNGQLHHVYPVAKIRGKEIILDATYPRNIFGVEEKGLTAKTDLTGVITMKPTLNVLEGDSEMNINPELMGASFIKKLSKRADKLGTKIKKAGKVVLKTPGVKDAIASAIPGGAGYLAKARALNKKIQIAKAKAKISKAADISTPGYFPVMPEVMQTGLSKKAKIGISLAIGGAVLFAVTRKK